MKKQFLECGKIVTTQGIRGEVRVQPWCDTPSFLLDFETLYLDKGSKLIKIQKSRVQKNVVILKIEGVETAEQAVLLRNQVLYIKRSDAQLGDDEYFVQDLIGCTVLDVDTGKNYGTIFDVESAGGANDIYCIENENGKKYYVPVIPQVVLERDIENGIVKIRPLEGLFDD